MILPFSQELLSLVRRCDDWLARNTLGRTLLTGATCGIVLYLITRKRHKLPPGPRGLPLLGNLLDFRNTTIHEKLFYWRFKYGPVFTVKTGMKRFVAINRIDEAHEALVKRESDFAGRVTSYSINYFSDGGKSLLLADYSPTCSLQKKLANKALRYYLLSLRLEKAVESSLVYCKERLEQQTEPFTSHDIITNLIFNVINCICFSDTCNMNDPYFIEMLRILDYFNTDFGNGYLEDFIPPLRLWHTKKFRELEKLKDQFFGSIKSEIDRHRDSFSEGPVRDFCDSMLKVQAEAKVDEEPELFSQITDLHITHAIADMLCSGMDTIRFTIEKALLFMALNPHIQAKVQEEIDQLVGDRPFSKLSDKSNLPYTNAVLYEVMRLSTAVPTGLPHKTVRDTKLGDYEIPKGTMVLINYYAIHHDPLYWDDPEVFRPERFLNEDKTQTFIPKSWLPFSAGQRACMGESIAMSELFLVFAGLLKHFKFLLPPGTYSFVGGSCVRVPTGYRLLVEPRLRGLD